MPPAVVIVHQKHTNIIPASFNLSMKLMCIDGSNSTTKRKINLMENIYDPLHSSNPHTL